MKKTVPQLALFLMMATILNVALTWTFAMLANPENGSGDYAAVYYDNPIPHRWEVEVYKATGSTRIVSSRFVERWAFAIQVTVDHPALLLQPWCNDGFPKELYAYDGAGTISEAFGFPLLDMTCSYDYLPAVGTRMVSTIQSCNNCIKTRMSRRNDLALGNIRLPRVLPTKIIWSGFVVNVLVFTSCLWLAAVGAPMFLRMYRISKGRCSNCGYPRGKSIKCSECGHSEE